MARVLIMRAIEAGAPAYNAGRVDQCARIYEEVAAGLLRSQRAELRPSVVRSLEDALGIASQKQGSLSRAEADQLAWSFRRAFDEQLLEGGGDKPPPVATVRKAAAGGVAAHIDRAIEEGVPVYNRGDTAGCERIYRDVAGRLLDGTAGDLSPESRRVLELALQRCPQLPDANARAWELRRALDALRAEGGAAAAPMEGQLGRQRDSRSSPLIRDFVSKQGLDITGNVMNDTVMGGRSDSEVLMTSEGAMFQGNVTRRGGGGFASVRFEPRDRAAFVELLRSAAGIAVTVKRLQGPAAWKLSLQSRRGSQWQQDFEAPSSSSSAIRIPLSSLQPTIRGMPTGGRGLAGKDLEDIQGFGFLLSFLAADGSSSSGFQEGPFALNILSVSVY
ncbi:unnamed protein product [Polarella glacialis]|uniref:NADH:ubiquinone oxidoreductase intermediate-associated protein 30 domain-containing protein n=1 Tax=Polarella glacialis TaxID=89957 RepID=A0A813IN36_POLGL|nr:unnamed protein product [Polarella glacialis]CAE8653721.1 unnamed protein product [Polarella glacialis]